MSFSQRLSRKQFWKDLEASQPEKGAPCTSAAVRKNDTLWRQREGLHGNARLLLRNPSVLPNTGKHDLIAIFTVQENCEGLFLASFFFLNY